MKKRKRAFLAAAALMLGLTGCKKQPVVTRNTVPSEEAASVSAASGPSASDWGRTVSRDGVVWRYNSRLRNILFLGVDPSAGSQTGGVSGSGGRAEILVLLIMDPEEQTIRMLSIPAETETEIDLYDRSGSSRGTGTAAVAEQYAYGSSAAKSCRLTKRTVSAMLLDLPINYYCSLTLDGITEAVKQVGGITLEIPDDWTDIDPAFRKGASVKVDASMAERFWSAEAENLSDRQNWFAAQIFAKLVQTGEQGAGRVVKNVLPYLESDMDGESLGKLLTCTFLKNTIVLPGQKTGDTFRIDEKALPELLLDVFYQKQ